MFYFSDKTHIMTKIIWKVLRVYDKGENMDATQET